MGIMDEELNMMERELEIFKKLPKEDVIFLINRGKTRENSAVEVLLENCLDFNIISKEQEESINKMWTSLKQTADCLEEEKEEIVDQNEDYSDAESILNKTLSKFSKLS